MTAVLAVARRGHRGLFAFAVAMAVLTPVLAVLAVVDDRVLLGAPLWFKPLKFAISLALYAATLAWMLGQLRERTLARTGWIVTAAAAIEMAVIVGQAAVGNRSHYNMDTPLSAALWSVMGVTIVVLWLATLAVALRFLREPGRDRAATTAIRLGLVVALIGLAEGFLMATAATHTVGAPDGYRVSPCSAGAPSAATCASRTSSACTPSRASPCSLPRSPSDIASTRSPASGSCRSPRRRGPAWSCC